MNFIVRCMLLYYLMCKMITFSRALFCKYTKKKLFSSANEVAFPWKKQKYNFSLFWKKWKSRFSSALESFTAKLKLFLIVFQKILEFFSKWGIGWNNCKRSVIYSLDSILTERHCRIRAFFIVLFFLFMFSLCGISVSL